MENGWKTSINITSLFQMTLIFPLIFFGHDIKKNI